MESAPDILNRHLRERVLVLDGAMGTSLRRLSPAAAPCDLLTLTSPDLVSTLHHQYLEAGSDIISTNTFASASAAQTDPAIAARVHEIAAAGARLARAAADAWTARTPDRPRFVAGAIGPARRAAGDGISTFDARRAIHLEQARGLLDGGCDLLLVETIVEIRGAEAALAAIADASTGRANDVPVMLSVGLGPDGRLLSGERLEDFCDAVGRARPFALGVNCASNAAHVAQALDALAVAGAWISCHPSAGLPDAHGAYPVAPEEMAALLRELLERHGVAIAGGCCGTTPAHIRAMAEAASGVRPRQAADSVRDSARD